MPSRRSTRRHVRGGNAEQNAKMAEVKAKLKAELNAESDPEKKKMLQARYNAINGMMGFASVFGAAPAANATAPSTGLFGAAPAAPAATKPSTGLFGWGFLGLGGRRKQTRRR